MCLSSVSLDMQWESQLQTYVGYGYKNYNKNIVVKNKWLEASGTPNAFVDIAKQPIPRNSYPDYNLGFHIFQSIEDAVEYNKCTLFFNANEIYLVAFTDVIGYGKQEPHNRYGCVISRYMFVCKEVNKKNYSKLMKDYQ